MTATDELRKLLDERGVEWWSMHDIENGYHKDCDTEFLVYGCKHVAHEWGCRLQVDMLTPEQAIAATLGSHERTTKMYRDEHGIWHCAACERGADVITGNDGELDSWIDSWAPNYCPYCGAKVVSE